MKVTWTHPARADLQRIYDFNLARSSDRAERVDKRLRERAEMLAQFPLSGRRFGGLHVRALSLPDIQYVVEYRVDEAAVTVLRVRSTREIR